MDPDLYASLPAWKKAFVKMDEAIDRTCAYDGPPIKLTGSDGPLWLPAALGGSGPTPASQAEYYARDQFETSTTGGVECVTTSAVIARNIVKNQILNKLGSGAGSEPDLEPKDFANQTNSFNLFNWQYRLPSFLPLVGGFMHPVLQLPHLLDHWGNELNKKYHLSFSHTLTAHNSPDGLINNLRNNQVTLVHGVWDKTFVDSSSGSFRFDIATLLGGTPHTMPLVMYDASADHWWFYNLAWKYFHDPDPYLKLTTDQLVAFWGRHYILNTYTPPFAMTTLIVH